MAEFAIPVIDIEPYRAGDPAGTKRVAEAVGVACARIGFLVIGGPRCSTGAGTWVERGQIS